MNHRRLCIAALASTLIGCGDDALVSPSDPDRLSSVLVIPGARRVSGQPPPQTRADPSAPQIIGGGNVAVRSGEQAVLELDYVSPTGYDQCIVQVEGASDYFVIDSSERATEGYIRIPVDIPASVDSGNFRLYTCIVGENGTVSNPVQTSVGVTRPSTGGSGNYTYCTDHALGRCADLKLCWNMDTGNCAYTLRGRVFDCGDCRSDQATLQACAQRIGAECGGYR